MDVSDPTEPKILHNFRYSDRESYGAVAVTREPDSNGGYHYLFALSDPGKDLAFWRSNGDDLSDPGLELEEAGSWDPHQLSEDPEADPEGEGWWGWQSINFVRDVDGDLYLVAADSDHTGEPIYVGEDWIRLFKEQQRGPKEPLGLADRGRPVAEASRKA